MRWLRRWWDSTETGAEARDSDYLWNPSDPRSFHALRTSGGAALPVSPASIVNPSPDRAGPEFARAGERLPLLAAAPEAGAGWFGQRRVVLRLGAVMGAVTALLILAATGALDSGTGGGREASLAGERDGATSQAAAADPTPVGPAGAGAGVVDGSTAAAEAYLQVVRDASAAVRAGVERFEGEIRESPDSAYQSLDAVTTAHYFAAFADWGGGTLQAGLSVLTGVEPPDALASDHAILLDYYRAGVALNAVARRAAADGERVAFRLAALDLRRLERRSAAGLSEDACVALVGPRPLCWRASDIPGGAYGLALNATIRDLAAPRWLGGGIWSLPAGTVEEDYAVAEVRLDAQLSDLTRAQTAVAVLRPPAEFAEEHARLAELLSTIAARMWVDEGISGRPVVVTRWAAAEGICLLFALSSPGFRSIAPLQLLLPERACAR
ncbi:MAG: hypothetical protein DK306_002354 [Chloroflexi bacterium]|nr:MAG: hypothetical protein DK306_002354 [Chloroflexota bacterium]